jgi:hypothetical protein
VSLCPVVSPLSLPHLCARYQQLYFPYLSGNGIADAAAQNASIRIGESIATNFSHPPPPPYLTSPMLARVQVGACPSRHSGSLGW